MVHVTVHYSRTVPYSRSPYCPLPGAAEARGSWVSTGPPLRVSDTPKTPNTHTHHKPKPKPRVSNLPLTRRRLLAALSRDRYRYRCRW